MDRRELRSKIEAAKAAVDAAEADLARLEAAASASAASPAERTGPVRDAAKTLRVARANLVELEQVLAQAKADPSAQKIENAKRVIRDAEANLDRALQQMESPKLEDSWVTKAVEGAFSDLRAAKQVLVDLEAVAADVPSA